MCRSTKGARCVFCEEQTWRIEEGLRSGGKFSCQDIIDVVEYWRVVLLPGEGCEWRGGRYKCR